jgi:hypothetical protein
MSWPQLADLAGGTWIGAHTLAVYNLTPPQFIARLPKHGPYGTGTCLRQTPLIGSGNSAKLALRANPP